MPNDLERMQEQLHDLTELSKLIITKIETRIPLVDNFDDRLVRAETMERSLANTALKLAAARALTSWVPGAVAGAVAGAAVAWVMLASGLAIAGAH